MTPKESLARKTLDWVIETTVEFESRATSAATHWARCSLRRSCQQLLQQMLPHGRYRMRPVAAGPVACGKHDRVPAGNAFDFALQDAELRRVNEVVRRIDGEQRRADHFEAWAGVIIPRSLQLVQQ